MGFSQESRTRTAGHGRQQANLVADIKKVVFSVGQAAPVHVQAMLPRAPQSRLRTSFECVERIFVTLADRDFDAVEDDEGIRAHSSLFPIHRHSQTVTYSVTLHSVAASQRTAIGDDR